MMPRVLHPTEYGRLAGTELEGVVPHLKSTSVVLVVEDQRQIIGCWSALQYRHLEGLWIHPDHRKSGSVGRRLFVGMGAVLKRFDERQVLTAALTEDVKRLIEKVGGQKLPGEHYVLPVGGF